MGLPRMSANGFRGTTSSVLRVWSGVRREAIKRSFASWPSVHRSESPWRRALKPGSKRSAREAYECSQIRRSDANTEQFGQV